MKKFLLFFLVFCTGLYAQALKFSSSAKSAVLFNPENGAILFEKRANEPHYPASTMKIATALFVLEKGFDLTSRCLATKAALETVEATVRQANLMKYPPYILEHDGVKIGIVEGKRYILEGLLYGLLLNSGNDAANVIAESCSGSVENFMKELNLFLKGKGIHQTQFQNPHGLYHPAQLTTALDMAKVGALAFSNETFRKIIGAREFSWEQGIIKNWNKLIKEGKYFYPKALGAKTGYTESSGFNLVAAAEHEGRRLVCVLFGCKVGENRFKEAISLFELAFSEKKEKRLLFKKNDENFSHQVSQGKTGLKAELLEDVVISYFPSEEVEWRAKLIWDRLSAPIKKGQKVGKLIVSSKEREGILEAPIFAAANVEKIPLFKWMDLILWLGASFLLGLYLFIKGSKLFKR